MVEHGGWGVGVKARKKREKKEQRPGLSPKLESSDPRPQVLFHISPAPSKKYCKEENRTHSCSNSRFLNSFMLHLISLIQTWSERSLLHYKHIT